VTWVLLALAGLWLTALVLDWRAVSALPDLPMLPQRSGAPAPAATVVVAVRNDAGHLRDSVRAFLDQRGVDLRLVVVDDRSDDGTPVILAGLAAAEPRLRTVTVRELPDGWLGKTHALHLGAADAAGEWLLFSDGDARLRPDVLARAIAAAAAAGADHVVVLPSPAGATFWGRACLLAFLQQALVRVQRVNTSPQRSFLGTGAFNLVRAEAWRRVGGHERLRLEVVDDLGLARLLFAAGRRSRVFFAPARAPFESKNRTRRGFARAAAQ
jgi:glycosyltransferase involved in cell wall biosynthesis